MKKMLRDIQQLSKQQRWWLIVMIVGSLFLKFWMWYFVPAQPFGPDASDYLRISELINQHGLSFWRSDDPNFLWRLPVLPILISIFGGYQALMILQLLCTYLLAYLVYKVFDKLTLQSAVSVFIGGFTLFLPYINIAACRILTEFFQVLLIIYFLKKIFYQEYDWRFSLAMVLVVFLRPEGYIYILFLLSRTLYVGYYRKLVVFVLPILCIVGWMTKNKQVYDTFSMVNPIMSSRALIGGIYPQINTKKSHPFHDKFNFYKARDYVHSELFVKQYKQEVRKELIQFLKDKPLIYLAYRVKSILYSFSYIAFNEELMPDKNWRYQRKASYEQVRKNNARWGYQTILTNKDWVRLLLRLMYNGSLLLMNFIGLFVILFNFRKLKVFIFTFMLFSFIAVVEVDMRYFLTIQLLCCCFFILGLRNLWLYRSLRLRVEKS